MKNLFISKISKNLNTKAIISLGLMALLIFISMHVFAEDLLRNTETNLVDTVNGTGKKYLYIGEFIVACLAWLGSRSAKVFLGVLLLSVGGNVILKIGGIT